MSVPNSSPFETDLAEAIKKAQALAVSRDDIQWIPAVSNGFTDSRFHAESWASSPTGLQWARTPMTIRCFVEGTRDG